MYVIFTVYLDIVYIQVHNKNYVFINVFINVKMVDNLEWKEYFEKKR